AVRVSPRVRLHAAHLVAGAGHRSVSGGVRRGVAARALLELGLAPVRVGTRGPLRRDGRPDRIHEGEGRGVVRSPRRDRRPRAEPPRGGSAAPTASGPGTRRFGVSSRVTEYCPADGAPGARSVRPSGSFGKEIQDAYDLMRSLGPEEREGDPGLPIALHALDDL